MVIPNKIILYIFIVFICCCKANKNGSLKTEYHYEKYFKEIQPEIFFGKKIVIRNSYLLISFKEVKTVKGFLIVAVAPDSSYRIVNDPKNESYIMALHKLRNISIEEILLEINELVAVFIKLKVVVVDGFYFEHCNYCRFYIDQSYVIEYKIGEGCSEVGLKNRIEIAPHWSYYKIPDRSYLPTM